MFGAMLATRTSPPPLYHAAVHGTEETADAARRHTVVGFTRKGGALAAKKECGETLQDGKSGCRNARIGERCGQGMPCTLDPDTRALSREGPGMRYGNDQYPGGAVDGHGPAMMNAPVRVNIGAKGAN